MCFIILIPFILPTYHTHSQKIHGFAASVDVEGGSMDSPNHRGRFGPRNEGNPGRKTSCQKGPMTPFTGVIISPQLVIYKFIFGHL